MPCSEIENGPFNGMNCSNDDALNLGEHIEIEQKPEHKEVLTNELLLRSLQEIEPTVDGLSYVPFKFVCNSKALNDLTRLSVFVRLGYVHLANNELTDLSPLGQLRNLIYLNVAHNMLTEFPEYDWPIMTHLILHNNQIDKLKTVFMPNLQVLSLNHNQLQRLYDPESDLPLLTEENLPRLHTLELGHNQLYLLDGATADDPAPPISLRLHLPSLRALFLDHNPLISVSTYKLCVRMLGADTLDDIVLRSEEEGGGGGKEDETTERRSQKLVPEADYPGSEQASSVAPVLPEDGTALTELMWVPDVEHSALGCLTNLSVLSLRATGLRDLDGLMESIVPNLQYLNVRENLIINLEEVEKLCALNKLQTIVLSGNPISEERNYQFEALVALPSLKRVDKYVYTQEERDKAINEMQRRKAKHIEE